MRVFIPLLFLTFVLLGSAECCAAPQVRSDLPPVQMSASPIDEPILPQKSSPFSLAAYAGFSGGTFFEHEQAISSTLIGVRFAVIRPEQSWDANIELNLPQNLIGAQLGKRFFMSSLSEWKPYWKVAAGSHLRGADGFVNFIEIKRVQARGSFGGANLWNSDEHFYAEAGLAAALVGMEYFFDLGLNFQIPE